MDNSEHAVHFRICIFQNFKFDCVHNNAINEHALAFVFGSGICSRQTSGYWHDNCSASLIRSSAAECVLWIIKCSAAVTLFGSYYRHNTSTVCYGLAGSLVQNLRMQKRFVLPFLRKSKWTN
jgi:hypothetical protein